MPSFLVGYATSPNFWSYSGSSSCFPDSYCLNSFKGILHCLLKVTESCFQLAAMCCVLLCPPRCCCHFSRRVGARTLRSVVFYMFFHRDSDCYNHILNLSWNSSNTFDLPVFPKLHSATEAWYAQNKRFQVSSFGCAANISWQGAEKIMCIVSKSLMMEKGSIESCWLLLLL